MEPKRTTRVISKRNNSPVKRDASYYFQNLDIQKELLSKATSIAERMLTVFLRENRISLDVEDLTDKIVDRLEQKLQVDVGSLRPAPIGTDKNVDDFEFDDGPVIVKTEKLTIKGDIGKIKKEGGASIDESLDALNNFSL